MISINRRFRRGLVVGKFSPLHKGHQSLIDYAQSACEEIVVICYSNPELPGYSAEIREAWIKQSYPSALTLSLDQSRMAKLSAETDGLPELIPQNSDPAEVHRSFCALLCMKAMGITCDAVFTSEGYGPGFAESLARQFGHLVEHVEFDRARQQFPISGTVLRQNALLRRRFLTPEIDRSLPVRVLFLGAESSGKSTMASLLATLFDEPVAEEFGRELWERQDGILTRMDLDLIATTQVAREDRLAKVCNRFLFCDSSPMTTAIYSEALFGTISPIVQELAEREYDLTFLCATDFQMVQDGTRKDQAFRAWQQQAYEWRLSNRAHIVLAGTIEERLASARSVLDVLVV